MKKELRYLTSINNDIVKYLCSLNDKKRRNQERKFIVEGKHLVEEANKTSLLEAVFTTDEKLVSVFNDVLIYIVTDAIISKISTTKNPQNIIGLVNMPNNDLELFNNLLKQESLKLVLLDDINDPGNLGTIIRTTAAIGYDAIVMSLNTVDLYNEKVIRSTQGVIFKIPIFKNDLINTVKTLKKAKVKCFGTSLNNAISLEQVKSSNRFAICFGNEANGMNTELLKQMDQNIKLEMAKDVESLNVSVAAGILMYELKK